MICLFGWSSGRASRSSNRGWVDSGSQNQKHDHVGSVRNFPQARRDFACPLQRKHAGTALVGQRCIDDRPGSVCDFPSRLLGLGRELVQTADQRSTGGVEAVGGGVDRRIAFNLSARNKMSRLVRQFDLKKRLSFFTGVFRRGLGAAAVQFDVITKQRAARANDVFDLAHTINN